MSFLHSFPSTLTIISFYIILFISFFPFVPSIFVFISLHFAFVFFHFPFISFQFPFISFHVAFISFHLASVSFHFALAILSLTPDMAIENGNRAFYVQFLQPISLKESRKVPSVFALFINIAIKKMHRKWCWQWCMWINVCVCAQCCAIFYVHSLQPISCKQIIWYKWINTIANRICLFLSIHFRAFCIHSLSFCMCFLSFSIHFLSKSIHLVSCCIHFLSFCIRFLSFCFGNLVAHPRDGNRKR